MTLLTFMELMEEISTTKDKNEYTEGVICPDKLTIIAILLSMAY